MEGLLRKARLAAILGTFQSTLTNFKYIRKVWKQNCEEERLLGVSLTGILDHPLLSGKGDKQELKRWLNQMREQVISTNAEFADSVGVSRSTSVTAIKPSGTVSQVTDSASGIHPRFARYYIRRVRQDVKDPITSLMKDAGVPWEADVMKPNNTVIFSFPMRSPDTAVLRDEMTAIEQLELWITYLRHWTEHKPSITVYVREHEWMEVGAWCYKHFDELTGVSFLPYDNGTYRQAPYEEITKETYEVMKAAMPATIDWSLISLYEKTDSTTGTQELACTAGGCEI